jgi:N-acetylneuraminic acid mutarotase
MRASTRVSLFVVVCAASLSACGSSSPKHLPAGTSATSRPPSATPTTVSAADAQQLSSGAWLPLPVAPIGPRDNAAVIWTGHELVVWGGQSGLHDNVPVDDGAAYNPATRRWRLLSRGPLTPRPGQAAVWTGTEMVVWGGVDARSYPSADAAGDEGAAFNPATNTWRLLPPAPLTSRGYAIAAWTGAEVMILGGGAAMTTDSRDYSDGALYNPATNTWSHVPAPAPLGGHHIAWLSAAAVANNVYAWSEWSETHQVTPNTTVSAGGVDMYSYNLTTKTWRYLPADTQALPDIADTIPAGGLIYTRGEPVNCGDCSPPFIPEATAVYDPAHDRWKRLPLDPLDGQRLLSVWTGAALFSVNPYGVYDSRGPGDATVYNALSDTWSKVPSAPFACDTNTDPVWTGHQILFYCPRFFNGAGSGHDGLAYTPKAATT